MIVIKYKNTEINGDLMKTLTLKKAVKLWGNVPEDFITEEWEKLNPKRKAKVEVEQDSEQES